VVKQKQEAETNFCHPATTHSDARHINIRTNITQDTASTPEEKVAGSMAYATTPPEVY